MCARNVGTWDDGNVIMGMKKGDSIEPDRRRKASVAENGPELQNHYPTPLDTLYVGRLRPSAAVR